MVRTAINLYSVRDLDLPMGEILERCAAAGYDGVQFSGGFGGLSADELADRLDDLDLAVTAAHVDVDEMESDPTEVASFHETVGADGAVVPWLGPEQFESREATLETADRVDAIAADMLEQGFDLHYHNHDHEFVAFDDTTGFEVFADHTDALLEPDVGWIETAGHDPVEILERYGDSVEIVHMKDMADGEFCEIGDGDVDMQACADAARGVDAEWLVYEHDEPEDPAASIDTGAEFLAGL
ncbi:sugar phosphate isomerase/epimerase family protein [Halosimplex pelagicum]|uniref:Sugar phosphate isomerase/epimerase n=1 Tax=Halosimplex pelagicum TaxID=869886 RepID=A0A7D5PF16_9EURY|nr:sugar phosphate isomerase/epimerase [Halosimplex pelagicum]QLH82680.1 sugar phosphate isomerase/epimerase [Halosimplex pelagicum]